VNRVAVVHTGLSNIDSIRRAITEVGADPYVVTSASELAEPDHIVLPGVGSFRVAMERLRATGLDEALIDMVRGPGVPLLGICLGMQLMMAEGEEGGPTTGLGLVQGRVTQLEATGADRVPHVGWNEVHPVTDDPLFDGIDDGTDFYFVHSFHVRPDEDRQIVATTPYCDRFVSVMRSGDAVGTQFHPEKSHEAGLRLLRNFVEA
jgi:glutamine amidotransferase